MKPKRQNKKKDILFIIISSFIVVVAWIAFNIYHIYVTSTVSETLQMQLAPISASFDQATIQHLKTRENLVPIYDVQANASSSATIPPVTPTPTIPAITGAPTPTTGASQLTPIAPTYTPINRQGQ